LFTNNVVYTSGKYVASVIDTGDNLPLTLLTPMANLPPVLYPIVSVSTTLAKLVEKFLLPVSLKPVANLLPVLLILAAILPPVSLILVVHLDLRISP
jgi:hypothetical protein